MRTLNEIAPLVPMVLKALNESPIGAVVLICLSAFALVAFVVRQRR